jgi:small nuclear ribonucleoprotein (snRNP)-like protein
VRKMTAGCLILLLLISIAHVTSAKPQSEWSNLKNFIAQQIAIKTKDGVTTFGVLNFVDDSKIELQLADDERVSAQERSFKRTEVKRVWRAKLRFGESNTGKGALIGLGIGLGTGYLTAWVMAKRDSGPPHGFALFPMIGAGVGAIVGESKPKDHKKQKLIYSN